jgi:uncharacterized membrane protein YhfC
MDARYILFPLNGLLMLALPVGLGIVLTRRFRMDWRLWWIGAATFVLSQVGHIPFNSMLTQLFQRGILPAPPAEWRLVFNLIVLGLSAGLWEETARYAAYRWWARDARTWKKGLLLGAGHGGIEAIILGGLMLINFIVIASMDPSTLSRLVPPEQLDLAKQQLQAYWTVPLSMTLLGAVERALTIIMHLALSLLVLQVFIRRRFYWLAAAIAWHALANAATVYMAVTYGPFAAEGILAVNALLCLAVIAKLYSPDPAQAAQDNLPEPELLDVTSLEPVVTPESLDRSRYH